MGRCAAGLLMLVALGCGSPAPRPSDAEIHALAASAVGAEVEAPAPLLLHPLLIARGAEGEQALERSTFNAYDSASVSAIVKARPTEFGLCRTTPAGSCDVPDGGVAVVLSELDDLGRNGVGVGALVLDQRTGRPHRLYFRVRVKGRGAGWEVVEVKRIR